MKEVTPTQLAKFMNVTRQAVLKAERAGRIRRKPNGKFDVDQAMRDWRDNTDPARGGKRIPVTEARQPPKVVNNEFIDFWLQLFDQSAGPLAIELSKRTSLTPKEVWDFLGDTLLLQWVLVYEILGIPEDDLLDLHGVEGLLSNDEGQRVLEDWLREKVKSLKK